MFFARIIVCSVVKMEAVGSPEILVTTYMTTLFRIPEDDNLNDNDIFRVSLHNNVLKHNKTK
jgi:hypothetical protein